MQRTPYRIAAMTFTPRNLAALVCRHVLERTRPVLLVRHQSDCWSFLCGGEDHDDGDFAYVGVGHLIDHDASIGDCTDLALDHEAERAHVGGAWQRVPIPLDER